MKLSTYLEQEGLSAAAFAARLGVPASTVTRIMRGERTPRLETARKIEAATGGAVTGSDFLGTVAPEEGEAEPPSEAAA